MSFGAGRGGNSTGEQKRKDNVGENGIKEKDPGKNGMGGGNKRKRKKNKASTASF
jgi:hypothetical protein